MASEYVLFLGSAWVAMPPHLGPPGRTEHTPHACRGNDADGGIEASEP